MANWLVGRAELDRKTGVRCERVAGLVTTPLPSHCRDTRLLSTNGGRGGVALLPDQGRVHVLERLAHGRASIHAASARAGAETQDADNVVSQDPAAFRFDFRESRAQNSIGVHSTLIVLCDYLAHAWPRLEPLGRETAQRRDQWYEQ